MYKCTWTQREGIKEPIQTWRKRVTKRESEKEKSE